MHQDTLWHQPDSFNIPLIIMPYLIHFAVNEAWMVYEVGRGLNNLFIPFHTCKPQHPFWKHTLINKHNCLLWSCPEESREWEYTSVSYTVKHQKKSSFPFNASMQCLIFWNSICTYYVDILHGKKMCLEADISMATHKIWNSLTAFS